MRALPVWVWIGGAAAAAGWAFSQRQQITDTVEWGVDTVQAAVSGWASVNDGPLWVPVINIAENQQGLPPNLLARQAYQESRFRPEFIDGSKASSAGALGILQLMPQFFSSVRVPRPFSAQDTGAQIQQAAAEMARLFVHYQDWGLALAAYNDGQGNIDHYLSGARTLPEQTVNYVTQILADVPVSGAWLPA